MGNTTTKLRLWSHVRQVAPISGDATKDAWFTLNLAPVLVIDPNGAGANVDSALVATYLRPWLWSWTTIRVALLAKNVVQSTIDLPAMQVMRGKPDAVQVMFQEEFYETSRAFDSQFFTELEIKPDNTDTLDQDSNRKWKLYLIHASTYPGDIPIQAGLVTWFHIPYSTLAGADELVVAPVFDGAPFSTPLSPVKPVAGCLDLSQPIAGCPMARRTAELLPDASATPALTVWTYGAPSGIDLHAEWLQPPLPLRIPNTASWSWQNDNFIKEETYWISPPQTGWLQQANWHEVLEGRISGLFDLPLRLLEWADLTIVVPPPAPPGDIDAKFGTAFLSAMRDLLRTTGDAAGKQFVARPDGGTIADDIAQIVAAGPANAGIRTQLIEKVQAFDAQFDTYATWVARLTATLTNPNAKKRFLPSELSSGFENPPSDATKLGDWLKVMHRVRSSLFDPAKIQDIIIANWIDALAGTPVLAAIFAASLDKLGAYLEQLDLVTVLRLGFLGSEWYAQTVSDWYAPDKVTGIMKSALVNVYRDRFKLAPGSGSPYLVLQPRADGVTQAQQASIEAYLASFIDNWSTSQTGPKPTATETPDYSRGNHGYDIQFSSFTAGANAADAAFLATFRGVGILLRPTGNDSTGKPFAWALLHLAQYSIRHEVPQQQLSPPPLDTTRIIVAPTQINARNGLRQVSCTYRGQPISARSPASALSQNRSMQGQGDSEAVYKAFRQGPYQLWNPYRKGNPFYLPRLVFGQVYEAAAFAVGLAGELPAEIADPVLPWHVNADPSNWKPPVATPLDPYLRTLPVGTVRVEGTSPRQVGQGIAKLTAPSIPPNAYPITRSMDSLEPKDTVLLLADPTPASRNAWTNFATDRTQFNVRPPSVDPAIFASWPFATPPNKNELAEIIALAAYHTDILNTGDSNSAPDLTLDDPAVAQLSATLSQIFPASVPGAPQVFDIRRPTGNLMQQYQSNSIPVAITSGKPADLPNLKVPQTPTGTYQIVVSVPAGTVYKLEIEPVPTFTNFHAGSRKIAAKNFYIEVATQLPITGLDATAAELNKAITFATGRNLNVGLDVTGLTAIRPHIHRVELMVQRWRWQGRPMLRKEHNPSQDFYTFPYDKISSGTPVDAIIEPYDGIYFGERDSDDQLIVPGQVDGVAPVQHEPVKPGQTGPAAVIPSPLYRYDLSTTPQALYYRFAIRAFSRYEGYFTTRTSVESRGPAGTEQWRRVLPLCTRTVTAPKPAVRLIIPLTHTNEDEATPGLMAVLDDIWYDWAGLAEQFEVQISTAKQSADAPLEAGPDPIVSMPNYDTTAGGKGTPLKIEQTLTPIGPIGYTTDTDPAAPLFSKTCFIIPAPRALDAAGNPYEADLSWWILQLQFRRSLIRQGTQFPQGDDQQSTGLESEWTTPLQAQLLPASNLWFISVTGSADSRVDVRTLSAQFGQGGTTIRIVEPQGNQVFVNPTAFDPAFNRFEVWVLLTVELTDAFGNGRQEAFVSMVPFASLTTYNSPPGQPAPTTLRLVEIQAMKVTTTKTSWSDLAEDIFPTQPSSQPDPKMAQARIVRVSPPISKLQ
jgi:hypothetical protein